MSFIRSFTWDFLVSHNLSAHTITYPFSWATFKDSPTCLPVFKNLQGVNYHSGFYHFAKFCWNIWAGRNIHWWAGNLEKRERYRLYSHIKKSALWNKIKIKQTNKIQLSSMHNTLHKSCNVYADEVNMLYHILSDNMLKQTNALFITNCNDWCVSKFILLFLTGAKRLVCLNAWSVASQSLLNNFKYLFDIGIVKISPYNGTLNP